MELAYERAIVKTEITRALSEGSSSIDEIVRYASHKSGKLYRPHLVLITAETYGERLENAVKAAAAIEIGNISSLVLDDIHDNTEERRGIETCHKKYGVLAANMAALQLIFHAETLAANSTKDSEINTKIVAVMNSAAREAVRGQVADVSSSEIVSLDNAVEIARMKTGSLYAASMVIGGLVGKAPVKHLPELRETGYELGTAFQIKDDIKDVGEDCSDGFGLVPKRPNVACIVGAHRAREMQHSYSEKAINRIQGLRIQSRRLEELMREIA